MINLVNKVILVTGAASGMGRETSVLLSRLGAQVVMLDVNLEGLEETFTLLSEGPHRYFVTDLFDIESLSMLIRKIVADCGAISGLVHCAGITSRKPLNMLRLDGYMKIMTINVYSFIELVKCISRKGNHTQDASFVAISSVSSIRGYKAKTEYCMSKAALDAAVRCLALELLDKGIRINTIMPGVVMTPMAARTMDLNSSLGVSQSYEQQPMGSTEPFEVANLAAFLLSDATKTITGTSVRIDGGLCI